MMNTHDQTHLVPGRKPVLELLDQAREKIDTVFIDQNLDGLGEIIKKCHTARVRFRRVKTEELHRLFPGNHQGVLARIQTLDIVDVLQLAAQAAQAPLPIVLALDQVQDPGNVGTLARSLYALGGLGLLYPKDRSAFIGPGALKAAAGTLSKIPLCQVVNLSRAIKELKSLGFWIYGTGTGPGNISVFSATINFPAVLVLGNEDKGLRPGVAKHCDALLSIPMNKGFDSLNVAQAGAMIMGEMLRQYLAT